MGDCRDWREAEYKAAMTAERTARARTVFSARFAPTTGNSPIPGMIATATSNGQVVVYSIAPPVSSPIVKVDESDLKSPVLADPLINLGKHDGPAYDLLFYGEDENMLLLSCGDDGRIRGWRWEEVLENIQSGETTGKPILDLKNPQQKGPRSALSPIPETNALAADVQANHLYSAAGDGCAYTWDMVTGRSVMVFDGHSDYLHCIASRPSQEQVVTGSEDGTTLIWASNPSPTKKCTKSFVNIVHWKASRLGEIINTEPIDCRSGERVAVLDPWRATKLSKRTKERSPWVSCMALDASENWLVCGNGGSCVTLWSLPGLDAVTRIATFSPPQAVTITDDEIVTVGGQPHLSRWSFGGSMLSQVKCAPPSSFSVSVHPSGTTAVAGYGGLVDIISEFGSHLCTFRCK